MQAANGHVLSASVSNCASTIDEPQQPRCQERADVHVVRRLFCFDQLEPVVQPRVLPKHQLERAGPCQPATSRLYRL